MRRLLFQVDFDDGSVKIVTSKRAPVGDVSIKEVARLANVSIATVSRCVNNPEKVTEKTRLKVQKAILKTGYSPNTLAQSFRRGRTNMVMVVLPSVGDPFFTAVMRGIRAAARSKGYSVVIEETQLNTMTADEIGSMLVSNQTDGIILLASVSPFGTEISSTKSQRRLPIVIGCETVSPELADFPSVHIDNIAAFKAAKMMVSGGVGIIASWIAVSLHHIYQADPRKGLQGAVYRIKGYIGVCFAHFIINRFRIGVIT